MEPNSDSHIGRVQTESDTQRISRLENALIESTEKSNIFNHINQAEPMPPSNNNNTLQITHTHFYARSPLDQLHEQFSQGKLSENADSTAAEKGVVQEKKKFQEIV